MKLICKRNNIPTAKFKICKNRKHVKNFLKKSNLPLVVKANGLAAGKGVTICKTKGQVLKASHEIFNGKFKTSRKLVLEEFLSGEIHEEMNESLRLKDQNLKLQELT